MSEQLPLAERVDAALDSIRPYLRTDGGDVKVLEVDGDKVAHLELLGACGNCPMSEMTFKAGIEEAIRKAVPEITGITAKGLEKLSTTTKK